RGKMIKRTASNIRQTATTKIKTTVRAAHSVLRSGAGRAGRKLEDARAKGIIGRSGAILIRKGAAAALNPRMDLAAAYEVSRYAQRLRVADPALWGSVRARRVRGRAAAACPRASAPLCAGGAGGGGGPRRAAPPPRRRGARCGSSAS